MNTVIEQRDAALSQVSLYKYVITQYQFWNFFYFFLILGNLLCWLSSVENLNNSPYSKRLINKQQFLQGSSGYWNDTDLFHRRDCVFFLPGH